MIKSLKHTPKNTRRMSFEYVRGIVTAALDHCAHNKLVDESKRLLRVAS